MKNLLFRIVPLFSALALIAALTLSFQAADGFLIRASESDTEGVSSYEDLLTDFGLTSRMKHFNVPGISFAVIEGNQLRWGRGYGLVQVGNKEKIDAGTVFSVGSVSKVGTAVMALKMCADGQLDLDRDVNDYLESWRIPENRYTQQRAVTLRGIMSHTAGLTVHGFADYLPGEDLPTTIQILDGSGPAKNSPVYVNIPVGSRFRYSGGGTTVEQLLIEELTGKPFHSAANELLFDPLQMRRSSYQNPLPASFGNIAKAHDRGGMAVALPRGYQAMPEAAASGLWTTPSDFAKLMITLMKGYRGEEALLPTAMVRDMMTPISPSEYGLGPRIEILDNGISFSHGGSNDSYRARFIGYPEKGNGVVIFTNATRGSQLIDELLPLFTRILE